MKNTYVLRKLTIIFTLIFIHIIYIHSQISIQMSDIQAIMTPGTQVEAYLATIDSVNIGQTGGPNVYDFSNISFTDTFSVHVDSVRTLPELIYRYPLTAIIWGQIQLGNRHNNQIFEFSNNKMLHHGIVSIFPDSLRFTHDTPPEQLVLFPAIYNSSWNVSFLKTDTTFLQETATNINSTNISKSMTIDGYGTLILAGRSFECLRMKRTLTSSVPGDNEYWYMTREGALLTINEASSQPDTGIVEIENVVLVMKESLVSIKNLSQMPCEFSLYQNYPNPFNPSTNISYTIKNPNYVILKIYNMLGQEIQTLVNKFQKVGNYIVTFDAKNLPSGIYFYKLQVGNNFVKTKKMILLQ